MDVVAVCVGSVRKVTQSYSGMVMSYINDNIKQVKIRNQQYVKRRNTEALMRRSR